MKKVTPRIVTQSDPELSAYAGLTYRSANALWNANLLSKEQVASAYQSRALPRVRGLGKESLNEIAVWLGFVKPEPVLAAGMTLRDWFAGQALAGICDGHEGLDRQLAESAYKIADAMIEQRIQQQPQQPQDS